MIAAKLESVVSHSDLGKGTEDGRRLSWSVSKKVSKV